MKNKTKINIQCNGCQHLNKNPVLEGHCYMFREKQIGCKLNPKPMSLRRKNRG